VAGYEAKLQAMEAGEGADPADIDAALAGQPRICWPPKAPTSWRASRAGAVAHAWGVRHIQLVHFIQ
jgi:hypothetical protein